MIVISIQQTLRVYSYANMHVPFEKGTLKEKAKKVPQEGCFRSHNNLLVSRSGLFLRTILLPPSDFLLKLNIFIGRTDLQRLVAI